MEENVPQQPGTPPTEVQQRRRALARVVVMMTFMFVFFWALGADVPSSSGDEPVPIGPDDPSLPVVRYLASKIAAAADGLVYPSNFTAERYSGKWHWAGHAQGGFLRPALAPNVSAQFALREGHGPSNLSFVANEGSISMKLLSRSPYPSVPTLQDVTGEIILFDGDVASPAQLHVPLKGVYAADQGLLYMVGSTLGGRIAIVDNSIPSPSPSPSPTASVSPAPAEPSPSPSPSVSGEGEGGGGRALQSSPVPQPSQMAKADRCDLLFAMRFRPIDYDASWLPTPPLPFPSARLLSGGGAAGVDGGQARRVVDQQQEQEEGMHITWPIRMLEQVDTFLPLHGMDASHSVPSTSTPSPPLPYTNMLLPRFIREAAAVGREGEDKEEDEGVEGLLRLFEQFAAWIGGEGVEKEEVGRPTRSHPRDGEEGDGSSSSSYGQAVATVQDTLLSSAFGRMLESGDIPQWVAEPMAGVGNRVDDVGAAGHAAGRGAGGMSGGRRLSSAAPADLYPGMRYLPMAGHIVSPNCNFSMNMSVVGVVFSYSSIEEKLGGFVFAATMGGVALMLVTTYQIVQSSSASAATRVSLATVGMQWVLDGVYAFLYTAGGMLLTSLITAFAVPAFLHFALFVFLQIRFLLLIKKSRNPDIFTGTAVMQRELCKMYCILYPVLLLSFMTLYSGSTTTVRALLVLAYSYWWPQVFHSASRDSRSGLTRAYILTNTAIRLLPLAYLLCCPYNVAYLLWPPETSASALSWSAMEQPPPLKQAWMLINGQSPAFLTPARAAVFWSWARFGLFLIVWQLAQVAVIFLQAKPGWGPRFFVPYAFLPPKYNYHRRVTVANGRVLPDPAATAMWQRHPNPEESSSEGAAGAGGAGGDGGGGGASGATAPATNFLGSVLRSTVRDFTSTVRSTVDSLRWFAAGCSILARDGWKRTSTSFNRRLRTARARGFSIGSLVGMGRDDAINRSVSGPVLGGVDGSPAVAGANTSWLEFMSPRQRLGAAGAGGSGRYARLNGSTEDTVHDATGPAGAQASAEGAPKIPVAGLHSVDLREEAHPSSVDWTAAEEGRAGPGVVPVVGGGTGTGGVTGTEHMHSALGDEEPVGDASWGSIDCVVCMEGVSFPCRASGYMVTPCDHLFHTVCLRPWMEHKVECPTCRMQLPEP